MEDGPVTADWLERDRTWWVKLRRANHHIDELDSMVRSYEASRPFRVDPRPGRVGNEIAYVLSVAILPPADLSPVVGDAVHNLRSALDSVAFHLATRRSDSLTKKQQESIHFPIMETARDFDAWFDDGRRRGVFDDDARAGLRCVQPFAFAEEAAALGIATVNASEDARRSVLTRVNRIWNIDKHRRLAVLSWFPNLVYWSGDDEAGQLRWQPEPWGPDSFADGSLVGYLSRPLSDEPPQVGAIHEFHLGLADDPVPASPLVDTLRRWHMNVGNWVIPSALAVADGHPRPIMIPTIAQAFV
jgi:hypothetical protein